MSEDQLKDFITQRFDTIDRDLQGIENKVDGIDETLKEQNGMIISQGKDISFTHEQVEKLEVTMKDEDQHLWDALRRCKEDCEKNIKNNIDKSKGSIKEWVLLGLVGVLSFVIGWLFKIIPWWK